MRERKGDPTADRRGAGARPRTAISSGFLRSAAFYGGVAVFKRLTPLVTAPILTVAFSVVLFGVVDTLNTTLSAIALVLGLNISQGILRLYYERDEEEQRELFGTALLWFVGVTALFAGVACCFSRAFSRLLFGDEGYGLLLVFSLLRLPCMIAYEQCGAMLRTLHRPIPFAVFNVLFLAGNVAIVVLLQVAGWLTVERLVLWQTLLQATLSLAMLFFLRRYFCLRLNMRLLGELFRYSVPQLPSVLGDWAMLGGMPLLVSQLSTLYDTGIYGVAMRVASAFGMIIFAFSMAFDPHIMRVMSDASDERFRRAACEGLELLTLLLLPALFLLYVAPPLFPFLIDVKFTPALRVVPLIVVAYYLLGVSNVLGKAFAYRKKTQYYSYAQGAALLVFASLAWPLVGRFGFVGAGYLLMVSVAVQAVMTYWMSQTLVKVAYPLRRALLTLGLSVLAAQVQRPVLQVLFLSLLGVYVFVRFASLRTRIRAW